MKARLPQGYQNSAPNMNQMVRKAQKMQEDIGKIQEELAVKEFTKQVGGGAIELVKKSQDRKSTRLNSSH